MMVCIRLLCAYSDVKYQKLMSSLSNIEYQAEKTWLVREMATREQQKYDRLHEDIGITYINYYLLSMV